MRVGLVTCFAAAGLFLTSCDESNTGANATSSQAATTNEETTSTVATPPPPPPLTHREFVRRLDHLCKVGNRAVDRKFNKKFPETIYDTPESMDAYAAVLKRANSYVRRLDRRQHFFGLDPGDPEDIRNYDRYEKLTRRLANYSDREVVAAHRHDFAELSRLFGLEQRTRNHRTDLTADMGLRFCGA